MLPAKGDLPETFGNWALSHVSNCRTAAGCVSGAGPYAERRLSTSLLFHGIKRRDPPDCFFGDGIPLGLVDINKLKAQMRHARHLINLIVRKQTVKPRVDISMNPAAVCQQVINGMHSLSIDGEAISLAGRSGAGPWPFVAHIGPHSSGLRRF